jgi:tetratricopeptide (TPR) repeat protein
VRAVSDQDRKGKSSERDEDEEEKTSEESSAEEEDEAEASASKTDDDEPAEKKADDDEEVDEAAKRVASSLGVGDDEEAGEAKAEEKAEEEAAAPNRAQRRAEAAQRRKKRKTSTAAAKDDDGDEPLPKDKNARAKELLKRRREQAAEARPIQLLPGEMVDDALARSSSAVSKWIRENFGIIQWVILGALVAGGGYVFYQTRVDKGAANATSALMSGVSADRGRVMAEDKRTDEEKEADTVKVYKTVEERADNALAGYKKVISEHPGTGAAILGRLGEGNAYLDKHEWDKALEALSAVASSSLAGADPDVKGRALEGLGFAKEGKGDLDGALATFKELEGVDARGYKELGLYHQGRVLLAKGDKDKAKDLLKQVHDKLEQPTTEGQNFRYLQQMTDETLRRIDPTLVPNKTPMGGPKGALTPDQLEKLKRQLEEKMREHGDKH